jgi:predicted lipid-binding transport protein (Tim44 family)
MVLPERQITPEALAITAAGHAPASLAGVLDQIKEADPSFDEKLFLQGAKEAFARIVEGFAKGDLSRIGHWLAPPVLESFYRAIDDRKAKGQTLESRLDSISEADIAAARLDGSQAALTVTFVSAQTNVTRDAQGAVVAGAEDRPEEIRDVWVFARDLKEADPNWILVETR